MSSTSNQLKLVCDSLRGQSGPFICPIGECGRSYKTFAGIQFHICNSRHDSNALTAATEKCRSPRRERASLTASQSSDSAEESRTSRESSPLMAPKSEAPSSPDVKMEVCSKGQVPKDPSPEAVKGSQQAQQQPREGLTYAEAQRVVEIEIEGGLYRLNIEEPLNIVLSTDGTDATPECARQPDKARSPQKGGKGKKSRPSKTTKGHAKESRESQVRLPEAIVSIVDNYECPDAPTRSSNYYRFVEKSAEELDEMVEYDMDEEDCAWLEIVNKKRKKKGVSQEVTGDTFELLMDRLEKESYFQAQNTPSASTGSAIDDDAVCSICQDGECHNANAILFCDMCNLAVHQECYGVPYIPEGQWLCRRCLQSPSRAVDCVLCPNRGGAFKQTSDGNWGHVVCALWVPEVYFANTVFLEPIDNICNIPAARWKLTCYICKKRGQGACIQCHKANCYTAFHVTCAQQAGLYMKLEECKTGEQTGVRKTAFCDSHAPLTYKKADKMRSARKILQEKAKALPVVSIPTIPEERMSHIASLVNMPRKAEFLQRLVGYWTLKRQSRNGVSLLRRLQMSHLSRNNRNDPDLDSATSAMRDQLKYWQRLRQDLERARLLCELIRKREKLKREYVRVRERVFHTEINPLTRILNELITLLQERDPHQIFAEPVDTNEVTDYLTLITRPMDFLTMREKVNNLEYGSFAEFEEDFTQIITNCMTYNTKDTIFYKAAVKLRDQGGAIIRGHRENLSNSFSYDTGRLINPAHIKEECDSGSPIPDGDRATQMSSQEAELLVETFIKSPEYCSLGLDEKLESLLSRQKKLAKFETSALKTRSLKLLRAEVTKVRRKMQSLNRAGNRRQNENVKPNKSAMQNGNHEETGTESDSTVETIGEQIERSDAQKESFKTYRERGSDDDDRNSDRENNEEEAETDTTDSSDNEDSNSSDGDEEEDQDEQCGARQQIKNESNEGDGENLEHNDAEGAEGVSDGNAEAQCGEGRTVRGNVRCGDGKLKRKVSATAAPVENGSASKKQRPRLRIDDNRTPDQEDEEQNEDIKDHEEVEDSERNESGKESAATNGTCAAPTIGHLNSATKSKPKKKVMKKRLTVDRARVRKRKAKLLQDRRPPVSDAKAPGKSSSSLLSDQMNNSLESSSEDQLEEQKLYAIPLEPLDLVWAKCRGYPWYPALIIDPDAATSTEQSKTLSALSVPLPPAQVLQLRPKGRQQQGHGQKVEDPSPHQDPAELSNVESSVDCKENASEASAAGVVAEKTDTPATPRSTGKEQMFLVLFFDVKRTWQWLPRSKLIPLGPDAETDKRKLQESRKPAERKAVKKAFEDAIAYRCRTVQFTGEGSPI